MLKDYTNLKDVFGMTIMMIMIFLQFPSKVLSMHIETTVFAVICSSGQCGGNGSDFKLT